jgi:hypothetical protein
MPIRGGRRKGRGGAQVAFDHVSADRLADMVNALRTTSAEEATMRLFEGPPQQTSVAELARPPQTADDTFVPSVPVYSPPLDMPPALEASTAAAPDEWALTETLHAYSSPADVAPDDLPLADMEPFDSGPDLTPPAVSKARPSKARPSKAGRHRRPTSLMARRLPLVWALASLAVFVLVLSALN